MVEFSKQELQLANLLHSIIKGTHMKDYNISRVLFQLAKQYKGAKRYDHGQD
jgi:hypothetical protein